MRWLPLMMTLMLGTVAACDDGRPPALVGFGVECRTSARQCPEPLRDGVCPRPAEELVVDPYGEGPGCAGLDTDAAALAACDRSYCGPCRLDDTCHSCEVDVARLTGTTNCPIVSGGGGGGWTGGGGGGDPDPNPAPAPGSLEILTFTYDQPVVGPPVISPEPFRRLLLDPELTPVAGMSARGLLWILSDDGRLAGFDIGEDPPALVVGPHDLGLLLDEGVLTPGGMSTWADSGSDFVNLAVRADQGLYFFHVDVPRDEVVINPVRQFREGTVSAFKQHPLGVLRNDGYVVIGTSSRFLWLTESLGELPFALPLDTVDHTPKSITLEAVSLGDAWVALTGTDEPDRIDRLRGRPLDEVASVDRPAEIVSSVSGGDSGTTVVADGIVVLVRSPAGDSGAVLVFAGGDLARAPARLDFDERVVSASTKRVGDVLLVFVLTTGTVHRLRVYRIDAIAAAPNRTFVELVEHEIAFEPVKLSLGSIPAETGPESGLFHVLVAP